MKAVVSPPAQTPFRKGLQAGAGVAVGYFPVSLTFGLTAKSTGLGLTESMLMSLLVFAGASQFLALNMIAAHAGAWEVIFSVFAVNSRHFLMSLGLRDKVEEDHPWKKALYAFAITDETFSVSAMEKGRVSTAFLYGLCFLSYIIFAVGTGCGYLIGSMLPPELEAGMNFALYALFIGLLVPAMKTSVKVLLLVILSGITHFLLLRCGLDSGWSFISAALLASLITEGFSRWRGVKA
ncbi:autotransporter [Marinithermofilum abyssi]|uniref:Autotransporter n=1 Tax=Marinithermofilum abyssi TaxID=1571185 RepID=A0A8J2YCU6_9BACL|nr:AzlC family ABC transporter permease [Marinithermofilum abyssi]GGE11992.1 autotransporter [Marinithermofilum abyssi]